MEIYLERPDPQKDLGGLCECFINESSGLKPVASAHIHRHFELLYCLKGGYELTVEHRSALLRPGDAALIHPMQPHQTRTLESGENSYLVLKFTSDALLSANHPYYEMKAIFPYLHFSGQRSVVYTADQLADGNLPALLHRIFEERRREEFGYEMALRADVTQVLLWFIRAWNRSRAAAAIDERTLARLQTAMSYIGAHLDDELTIADVASRLDMGVSSFSRFFARAAGMTFPACVRSMRLSRAATLLVEGRRSVTDIALETGFNSASYLILCFRKQYGMTPARFRAMYGVTGEND